jgi:hypothetical protein
MARFLQVMLLQEPFDMGIDPKARVRYGFNIVVEKTESATFIEELIVILRGAQPLWRAGREIFATSGASIPETDSPVLNIIETGGPGGVRIQNQIPPAYMRSGAQIVARAKDPAAARTMAFQAYSALATVSNRTVNV